MAREIIVRKKRNKKWEIKSYLDSTRMMNRMLRIGKNKEKIIV